jgi:tetratricopeptide (TPR) repeat protein
VSEAERSELKARYGAAVTSGTRLLSWWLLLIVVLALVVEQQIRNRARATELLSADIATAQTHSRAARRAMGLAYDGIGTGFRELLRCDSVAIHPRRRAADEMTRCLSRIPADSAAWTGYLEWDAALLASAQHWPPGTLAQGRADSAVVMDSLRAIAGRARAESGDTVRWRRPTFPATIRFPPEYDDVSKQMEDSVPVAESNLPARAVVRREMALTSFRTGTDPREGYRRDNLSAIARDLDAYGAAYKKFVREQSEIQPAIIRIQELAKEEQALPTPFGGFNLDPRLALLGLAAAALLTYLVFLLRGVQARAMACRYFQSAGESVVPPPGAPAWIFGGDSTLGTAVGWSRKEWSRNRGIAILVHACWLGVVLWLVRDSLAWDVSNAVRFPSGRFTAHVLALGLAFAFLFAALQLRPRRAPSFAAPRADRARRLGRREFLYTAGLVVAAAAVGALVWVRVRSQMRRVWPALDGKALTTAQPSWWYVNPRTGVLHCEHVCGDHIEGLEPLTAAMADGVWDTKRPLPLHRGKEALVLESLAVGALRDGKKDLAVQHLERAIEYAPTSYRLYDRLVRLFGSADNPQYEKILPLLQRGLEGTSSLPEPLQAKVREAFTIRIQRVAARKHDAAERYKDRQKLRQQYEVGPEMLEPVG